jgi:hypothetical protein
VLSDRPVGLGVELVGLIDAALTMSIGNDHAGVHRKALATEGIRLLFDEAGVGAGIARQDARFDLSALPSD